MKEQETYIAVLLAVVFVLWIGWKLRLSWQNFLFSLSRRRGSKGEATAIRLLQANGFDIVSSQVPFSGSLSVNGEHVGFDVRPDFLVERNGIQYLAEVKTGKAASHRNRNTRRQLLEYVTLGKTDTILLVDATAEKIMEIRF